VTFGFATEIITDQWQLWQMVPTKQHKQHKLYTKI
jgi:hypothetical protein